MTTSGKGSPPAFFSFLRKCRPTLEVRHYPMLFLGASVTVSLLLAGQQWALTLLLLPLLVVLGYGQRRGTFLLAGLLCPLVFVGHLRARAAWQEGRAHFTSFGSPGLLEVKKSRVVESSKTPWGQRLILEISEGRVLGRDRPLARGSRVQTYSQTPFLAGETLSFRASFFPEDPRQNFDEFERGKYFAAQRILASVQLVSSEKLSSRLLLPSSRPLLNTLQYRLSHGIEEHGRARDLLNTLLLSERLFPEMGWLDSFPRAGSSAPFCGERIARRDSHGTLMGGAQGVACPFLLRAGRAFNGNLDLRLAGGI